MTTKTMVGAVLLLSPLLSRAADPECCFTNPQYSGTCKVKPSAEETCQSILDYLNNPMASGKGYCEGTDVRGNWSQVSCAAPAPTPSPSGSGSAPAASGPARRPR